MKDSYVGRIRFDSPHTRTFENVYYIKMTEADGELKLQESEVAGVEFWDRETIEANVAGQSKPGAVRITPNSVEAFKQLMKSDLYNPGSDLPSAVKSKDIVEL